MPDSYVRYLESEIRRRFGFDGVPIVMEFRPHRRGKEKVTGNWPLLLCMCLVGYLAGSIPSGC